MKGEAAARDGRSTSAAPVRDPEVPGPGDDLDRAAVAAIRERASLRPAASIILGSGLARALEALEAIEEIGYDELPGFPSPSVPGHPGRLRLGALAGVPVAAFVGRLHYYEGHTMATASLPVRVARLLGAGTMVLTAAVGAIDAALLPGTVVVGVDHVNLMGASPLRGWRRADGSPPFVDLSEPYDRRLARSATEHAEALGIPAAEGVYAAVAGPSYETPAEAAFLRMAGASVVGMSVVPEAVPARALGLRVLGLFAVTNAVGRPVAHEEVVSASDAAAASIGGILAGVLPAMDPKGA
jgi:purine-nucleoside phosphorylase